MSFDANPHLPQLAPFRWPMSLILEDRLPDGVRRQADSGFLTFFRADPDTAARVLRALATKSDLDMQRLTAVLGRIGVAGG